MRLNSSIYQEVPIYTLEEFVERAPEEMRTEEALNDEHTLMANRINFELIERQRWVYLKTNVNGPLIPALGWNKN